MSESNPFQGITKLEQLIPMLWPQTKLFIKQWDILHSLVENDETVVYAGNMLGKDYVAGLASVCFFLMPQLFFPVDYVRWVESLRGPSEQFPHTRRIVTTSIAEKHLIVLWGEINKFLQNSILGLTVDKPSAVFPSGGPIKANHMDLRLTCCKISYCLGIVCDNPEKMGGHHAKYTLFVGDEASGLQDAVIDQSDGWVKKRLVFGNCWPCQNFFRRWEKQGNLIAK